MITGRGELEPGTEPMRPGKWWAALICLAIGIGITRWIIAGAPPFGLDRNGSEGHIAAMLIRTEQTPNPATRKFLPGQPVMEAGTRDFADAESAEVSPLAKALFDSGMVEGVFYGRDFISVTRGAGRVVDRPRAARARDLARPFRQRRADVRRRHRGRHPRRRRQRFR